MARTYTGLDVFGDQDGLFPWTSQLIDVGGGVRQAVVDEGPRDARLTFLLLHGNPTWGFLWRRFIERLSPRFRVIVPDDVGFGRSDKPRVPAYYTLERHISNLETVLATLKADRVVPVVQDWGGPIGMGWATRHPGKVAGVVVLNTWAFVKDPPMRLPWLFKLLVLGRGGWRRATKRNIFTEIFVIRGGSAKRPGAVAAAYRAAHPTPEDRVGAARFPQLIPETHDRSHESWKAMEAIEDALPSLASKPALIVWAMRDPAFRKAALGRWLRLFRDVDGPHRLDRARHYLQEDAPEDILARIDAWSAAKWPVRSDGPTPGGRRKPVPR